MTSKQSNGEEISPVNAVFLGALASGVNVRTFSSTSLLFICFSSKFVSIHNILLIGFQGPTWNTLKSAFLMLGLSLVVMFGLAFSSSDSSLVLHVGFLVLIAVTLFFLLSWYENFSINSTWVIIVGLDSLTVN